MACYDRSYEAPPRQMCGPLQVGRRAHILSRQNSNDVAARVATPLQLHARDEALPSHGAAHLRLSTGAARRQASPADAPPRAAANAPHPSSSRSAAATDSTDGTIVSSTSELI